ncbi:MAG: hypothetical protein GY750_17265 [Lentisphaerae bacterium]|nr:hypothetical protein [Lentisphaerota bacterium]MCP4103148.1 hypothetical protein [Lentisphaerota bacterium]
MRPIRFVHCSDIHLGCSFKGVASNDTGLAGKLTAATFDAFASIINLAIDNNVDFVLIAGDLFDTEDRSLKSRLFLRDQLIRLDSHKIKSYIVCGNHDPLDNWSQTVKLPDSVCIFEAGEPQTEVFENGGEPLATITGVSFPTANVKKNLAKSFKAPEDNLPSIALLHTDVGSLDIKSYAPCQLKDLEKTDFDYWAIGHVHSFNVLIFFSPAVVYPGCSQGTSPRETGAKGCCLVRLEANAEPEIKFVAVDKVRYFQENLDISGCTEIREVQERLDVLRSAVLKEAEGREIILRLILTGRTALHRELRSAGKEDLDDLCNVCLQGCFVDRISIDTRNDIDKDSLRNSSGFPAEVLEETEKLRSLENLQSLKSELSTISRSCRELDTFSDDELEHILLKAEDLLLDRLVGDVEH